MRKKHDFYWLAVALACLIAIFFIAACVGTFHADNVDWQNLPPAKMQEGSIFAGLAAGLLSGAIGIGSSIANWRAAQNTQQETWNREDTAVQRRVADLKAAGLSPTLAAGSAAQTSVTSAPQANGNGIADALNAAAQVQGIKNARQENANMQTSRLESMANIGLMSRQGNKADAETNYFNAMANKAMIEGDWASILGSAQLSEMQERTKGYKYNALNNYNASILNGQKAFREALESDLIHSTGMNSSNSSILGTLSKWFSRGVYSTAEMFGNKDSYRFGISDKLKAFEWK